MKPLGLALGFAFAFYALTTAGIAEETERISRTISFRPGGRLQLDSFSGHVTVTGADRDAVVIDALRRGSRARLDHIKLDIRPGASTIVVTANRRDGWSWWWMDRDVVETDFDIQVPRQTSLDIRVFSAPVTVEGVEGSHDIHGFSSRVRLVDVTGSVRAHTFSGPVEIGEKGWKDGQDIEVDTFSGSIQLHLPQSARGLLTFRSFSGRLSSDIPLAVRGSVNSWGGRDSSRKVTAALGGDADSPVKGTLKLRTFSGSVRLDR